jgi:outer membrane immunogenic protein
MRRLFVILGLIASSSGAFAQEYEYETPILRGSEAAMPTPPTFQRWRGVYGGGQFGYSAEGANFGTGVNDLAASIVRNSVLEPVVQNLVTLPKGNSSGSNFGGFFGYNTQWEGAILGFEFNYSRVSVNVAASDVIPSLLVSNDGGAPTGHHFVYGLNNMTGSASVRITDLATFRARAGWIAGQFLPYAFMGVAVARADVSRSATLFWTRTDVPDTGITPIPFASGGGTASDVQNGGFYYGYAAGIGMDVFVMPNVFLRGEWEFVELPNIKGMSVNMNNLRAAVGVKF